MGGLIRANCGSDWGYRLHLKDREPACDACLKAHAASERERRATAPKPPRQLVPCGSPAAYRRHIRRGEVACPECRAAQAADVARYAKKRRAA